MNGNTTRDSKATTDAKTPTKAQAASTPGGPQEPTVLEQLRDSTDWTAWEGKPILTFESDSPCCREVARALRGKEAQVSGVAPASGSPPPS